MSQQPFTAASLAALPPDHRKSIVESLSPLEREQLHYSWAFWARPEQLAPTGEWNRWLICAGRGFGKTRSGAEWVRQRVAAGAKSIAFAGRSAADVRDVMVEGQSGILAISPPWDRPKYEPSKRRLTWPGGAVATTFSADEPDSMRGPNTDTVWADELASWQYTDSWTQLCLGLRSIQSLVKPQAVITTTPRPTKLVRDIIADPTTTITRGSTYDNAANLAPSWLADVERRWAGTRTGRQELFAHVLDDAVGALWKREWIDDPWRVKFAPELRLIVVAVDPATTSGEDSDETGIVVVGLGVDGHGYVLADHSGQYTPDEWAKLVVKLYTQHDADAVVAEVNQGGDMVESTIRTAKRDIVIRKVHASKAKRTRAEPVAALYEQHRVHHCGTLTALEDQYCTWEPDIVDGGKHHKMPSPDHLDAAVWGITYLMVDKDPDKKRQGVRPRLQFAQSIEDRPIG